MAAGRRYEGETRGGRHRCLVEPLVDRVMHTASSSADLASDGYELERDVTAENSLDSTGIFRDLSETVSAHLSTTNFSKREDN